MPSHTVVAKSIARLACGAYGAETEFGTLLSAISKNLVTLTKTLGVTVNRGVEESSVLTPYLMRSVMEVSLTGVIGRLDPFRLLTLAKVQVSSEYDLGKRANSAIQWFGDVHSKEISPVKWDPEKKSDAYSRALLDGCWNEIAWSSTFERSLNWMNSGSGGWSAEFCGIEPKNFIRFLRGRLIANYSALSKGVHNEFVVDRSVVLDATTIAELVSSSSKIIGFLCLVSHFVDHAALSLKPAAALKHFKNLEEAAFS